MQLPLVLYYIVNHTNRFIYTDPTIHSLINATTVHPLKIRIYPGIYNLRKIYKVFLIVTLSILI